MFDCYTGFKWIAAVIRENEGKKTYIGGGEESYGFLPEEFARDKDAVSSCALMAEIAAWAKDNGKTLFEQLQDIYVEYGFGKEKGISVVRKGKSGAEEIAQMMRDFRTNPPKEIAGSKVSTIKDYETLKTTTVATGAVSVLDFPCTSNVLQYFTEDGTKISVRPSGTEPKIKFYIEVIIPPQQSFFAPVTDCKQLTSFLILKTPKKAKINASLKSIISLSGIIIL